LGEIINGRENGPILLARQALHAQRIRLLHPTTGNPMEFSTPIPADMQQVLDKLIEHRSNIE
jgi:hypothetical protein